MLAYLQGNKKKTFRIFFSGQVIFIGIQKYFCETLEFFYKEGKVFHACFELERFHLLN